jgi:rSAM/selenodomain-associated transferase 1
MSRISVREDPPGVGPRLSEGAVVIFAKAPRPGRVKTRVAAGIGEWAAAELQAAMLADTAEIVSGAFRSGNRKVALFCAAAEADDADPLRALLPPEFDLVRQGEGDLGERLARVFQSLLDGRAGLLALGGDCPDLTAGLTRRAVEALERADGVLGPARDGGYWAIGLRRFEANLFSDMPWSTADVADLTRRRFRERRLRLEELPVLADLDTPADLRAWAHCPNPDFHRTLAWCRRRRFA